MKAIQSRCNQKTNGWVKIEERFQPRATCDYDTTEKQYVEAKRMSFHSAIPSISITLLVVSRMIAFCAFCIVETMFSYGCLMIHPISLAKVIIDYFRRIYHR